MSRRDKAVLGGVLNRRGETEMNGGLSISAVAAAGILAAVTVQGCDESPEQRRADQERHCNLHADYNIRRFDAILRSRGENTTTGAELQRAVVKLCMDGTSESDAFASYLVVLASQPDV
jgi:hypothetical protein